MGNLKNNLGLDIILSDIDMISDLSYNDMTTYLHEPYPCYNYSIILDSGFKFFIIKSDFDVEKLNRVYDNSMFVEYKKSLKSFKEEYKIIVEQIKLKRC